MAFHGPSYGLDAELKSQQDAKYSVELENQATEWIEALTGETKSDEFHEWLKDGQVLCKLANAIQPGSAKMNTMRAPFKQMENIGNFLTAIEKIGVPKSDLFQTVDLFEAKNMGAVVQCIHSLGRAVQRNRNWNGPTLGARLSEGQQRQWTEEQLRQGHSTLGALEAGASAHQRLASTAHTADADSIVKLKNVKGGK